MQYYVELEIEALKLKVNSRDQGVKFSGFEDAYKWYMSQRNPIPCCVDIKTFQEVEPLKFYSRDKGNYGNIIITLVPAQ